MVAHQGIQVDNAKQQEPAPVSELDGYTSVGEWFDGGHAGAFFPTRCSADWFIKNNRRELIEAGALIPRAGRSGSLIKSDKFGPVVIHILRRRALEKAADTSVTS